MRIDNDPKLDFDDVLIRPKRSEAPNLAWLKRFAISLCKQCTDKESIAMRRRSALGYPQRGVLWSKGNEP